jgi:hypothetical protein
MLYRSFVTHSIAAVVLMGAAGCASKQQNASHATDHAKEAGPHAVHWS